MVSWASSGLQEGCDLIDILFLRFIIVCDCSFPVPVLLAPIVMCEQSVSLIIDAKVIIINAFLHMAAQPKSLLYSYIIAGLHCKTVINV